MKYCRFKMFTASPHSAIQKHITGRELTGPRPTSGPLQTCDMDTFITDYELRHLIQVSNQHFTNSPVENFILDDHKMFYEKNVVKTIAEIIDICKETKFQGNSAWRLNRSIRITGSSCYELYTYYSNKNSDWTK